MASLPPTGATGFAPDEPAPGTGPFVPFPRRPWLDSLQRVTSSGRFIPEVDGLRFIAIASVLLFHLSGQILAKSGDSIVSSAAQNTLLSVVGNGHIGVQLFFAISGFILALPFANFHLNASKPVSLRAYYLRRLTRLEPPYLVTLALFFVLLVVVFKLPFVQLLPHLLASVFYLHNLIYAQGSAINYVAWSLEVEVQFYLLAPLLALLFGLRSARRRRAVLVGLMLLFIMFQQFAPHAPRIQLSLLGQGQFFVAGFLLADFYLTQWGEPSRSSQWWDILFFAGWPLFFVLLQYPTLEHWAIPFAIILLYTATFRGRWSRRLLSQRFLTTIGGMCYSIYLIHFQLIALLWRFFGKVRVGNVFAPNFALQCALMLPFILAVSALFYLLVEKPCMSRDWPTRLAGKAKARAST